MVGEEFSGKTRELCDERSLRGSFNKENQQKHAEWYY